MWVAYALICNAVFAPQGCKMLVAHEATATEVECLEKKKTLEEQILEQFPDGSMGIFHFSCEHKEAEKTNGKQIQS